MGFPRRNRCELKTDKAANNQLLKAGDAAFLRRFVRSKDEPLGEEVKVIDVYPQYAIVQRPGHTADTVNLRHLSKLPVERQIVGDQIQHLNVEKGHDKADLQMADTGKVDGMMKHSPESAPEPYITRSGRTVRPPDRYGLDVSKGGKM